jgi:hypothetical protein
MTEVTLVKRLVIVDRGRRELFELLVTRFAPEPQVRVVFDRRTRVVPPPSGDRRQAERRSNAHTPDQGYRVAPVVNRESSA